MSLRDKVRAAYLAKQGQRPQQQPQPEPNLNDILWLMEQEQEAKQLNVRRRPRRLARKVLDILRKTEV